MSDEDSRESATPSPTFCEGIERQDRVHRPNVDCNYFGALLPLSLTSRQKK